MTGACCPSTVVRGGSKTRHIFLTGDVSVKWCGRRLLMAKPGIRDDGGSLRKPASQPSWHLNRVSPRISSAAQSTESTRSNSDSRRGRFRWKNKPGWLISNNLYVQNWVKKSVRSADQLRLHPLRVSRHSVILTLIKHVLSSHCTGCPRG